MKKIQTIAKLGYTVDSEGIAYKPNKEVQKTRVGTRGYLIFSIRLGEVATNEKVHRLQAFMLYGDKMLEKDVVVRHLDGNQLNNKAENIAIGSRSDNYFDIPEIRR